MRTTLEVEQLLRGAALRVTRPRVAVLTAVVEHPHADTDSIIGVVREELGEVSTQAVYDVLWARTAARLVRRIGSRRAPRPAEPAEEANWDIYLARADGTGLQRLTRAPSDDVSPAWGPGNRIAFESDRSGDPEIWTIAADGTGAKQVTRHEGWDGDPDWSPDGTQLAYATERGDDTEISVTSTDGRDTIQVTRNDVDDDGPAWSPAGDRIAFARNAGEGWSIWVVEPDGSNARRVTRVDGDDEYPAWSADGTWILFSRDTGDLVRQVMRVRPNGTGLAPVTNGRIQSWLPSSYAPRP